MTLSRTPGVTANLPRRRSTLLGVVAALAFSLWGMTAHAADAKDAVLSKEDKACLECHAKPNLEKTLGNGEKLSLVIPAKGFAQSVHNSSGCEGCHSDIDLASHGKEPKTDRQQARQLARADGNLPRLPQEDHEAVRRQRALGAGAHGQREGPAVLRLPQPARDAVRQAKVGRPRRAGHLPEMPPGRHQGLRRKRARPLRRRGARMQGLPPDPQREGRFARPEHEGPVPVLPQGRGDHARRVAAQHRAAPRGDFLPRLPFARHHAPRQPAALRGRGTAPGRREGRACRSSSN